MDEDRIKHINGLIVQKEDEIQDIDKSFFGDVIGVSQALGQLKEALEKVDKCLEQRKFEKASSLGYGDVSSEFIFLQRCLGSLTGTIMKKEELIQNICLDLSKNYKEVRNEEVAPLVEQKIESLKPIENPMQIEILIGKNTLEKLHSLHKINHTPIEHLVELILSSVMQNDGSNPTKVPNAT